MSVAATEAVSSSVGKVIFSEDSDVVAEALVSSLLPDVVAEVLVSRLLSDAVAGVLVFRLLSVAVAGVLVSRLLSVPDTSRFNTLENFSVAGSRVLLGSGLLVSIGLPVDDLI
ncbi:hypothetical protein [Nitrosomonas sp. Nm84]|uniref:hypothetical protein n=1 Tax=Nitrosomonas sp. Nm84 TaxID=200124 RepID=UPI0014055AD9|nr:hypothetical protein [Nitrosomonas sp. Nm84]